MRLTNRIPVAGIGILSFSIFCWSSPAAPAPSVEAIVERTEQIAYYEGEDGKAKVSMTIKDGQGRERHRKFLILRRDDSQASGKDVNADQKYFVHIQYPADVRSTVLMVWKHHDRDDDRWFYLPALDLVKRIAAGDKRTSFLGSDFCYEDISGRSISEDTHELIEVTENYYVLDNVPKDPEQVNFSHYTLWVHRETFIPVRAEYFDKQNKKYREYEALEVSSVQGHPTVMKSRMRDLRTNGETLLEFSQVAYDLDLPETIFSERYLRHPPGKYLR